jgi:hypothetical protein
MMMHLIPIAAALVLAGLPLEAKGQSSAERRAREDRLARLATELPERAGVRVSTRGLTVEGSFIGVKADSFLIATRKSDTSARAIGDITFVWLQERHVGRAAWKGARIGAALIGGTAILGFLVDRNRCDSESCVSNPFTAGLWFTIPGALAGSVVGAVVGVVRPSWRRLYPER